MYGMSAFRLSRDLSIVRRDANEFLERYFATYPKIQAFISQTIAQAEQAGEVRTLLRRRRPLPNINNQNKSVKAGSERIAINTPIQGSAADLLKLAILSVERRLRSEQLQGGVSAPGARRADRGSARSGDGACRRAAGRSDDLGDGADRPVAGQCRSGSELGRTALSGSGGRARIVGVSGKICTGKNFISDMLAAHGYHIIDVDRVGHIALAQRQAEIVRAFGPGILTASATATDSATATGAAPAAPAASAAIDRSKLGAIVFQHRSERQRLEAIVHPLMVEIVQAEIAARPTTPIVINAALLFHMALHRLCDCVLWIRAPLLLRLTRAMQRAGSNNPKWNIVRQFWVQRRLTPQFSALNVDIHIVTNRGGAQRLNTVLRQLHLV